MKTSPGSEEWHPYTPPGHASSTAKHEAIRVQGLQGVSVDEFGCTCLHLERVGEIHVERLPDGRTVFDLPQAMDVHFLLKGDSIQEEDFFRVRVEPGDRYVTLHICGVSETEEGYLLDLVCGGLPYYRALYLLKAEKNMYRSLSLPAVGTCSYLLTLLRNLLSRIFT